MQVDGIHIYVEHKSYSNQRERYLDGLYKTQMAPTAFSI